MVARSRQQDAVANNMANAETSGFKRQSVFMRQLQAAQASGGQSWLMPMQQGTYIDFSQGPLDATNDPFNLAIDGEGFFVVETPEGARYTRAGNFSRNAEGELVTSDGFSLQSDGGPVVVTSEHFVVGERGEVSVDGTRVGNLQIVRFANPQQLKPIGRSLFHASQEAEIDTNSSIRQGYLERANFNLVHEMIQMMTTFRYYETAQKAVQIQDGTLDRAVNQIGRVQRG